MATNDDTQAVAQRTDADPLTGEIVRAAPLPSAAEYGQEYRVSDLFPEPSAWAEYPQVDVADVIDQDLIIMGAMAFDSMDYDGRRWAILLFHKPLDGELLTTACGGDVLMRKIDALQSKGLLAGVEANRSIVGRITLTPSKVRGHQPYYNLV